MPKERYQALGVSASKAGLHRALEKAGVAQDDGMFTSVFEDQAGDSDYASFLHCDGAGTKTIVSYLAFRETEEADVFQSLADDALAMNLDDVFCIGVPRSLALGNIISRNSHRIPDKVISAIVRRYSELSEQLKKYGINISLAGGETADCGDVVRTLSVDAVLSGRIEKSKLLRFRSLSPGDLIVGLSSTGQCKYEQRPNSGIGSNGLTLARHALLASSYSSRFPEIESDTIGGGEGYTGRYLLRDSPDNLGMSVGEALASPTRTYAPLLKAIYEDCWNDIRAAVHCTGGGQTKILKFLRPGLKVHKKTMFNVPPLFNLIKEAGDVSWAEMYQVFNMGHRMELYVAPSSVEQIKAIADSFSIRAKIIGEVESADSSVPPIVTIESADGPLHYQQTRTS